MSTSSQPNLQTGGVTVPITGGEPLLRTAEREGSILLARNEITITHARYAARQPVADPPQTHRRLLRPRGRADLRDRARDQDITVAAGGFLAAPPQVAHSFRTDGDRPARWLTIHAHDGGFAAFIRGVRDGVTVQWGISPRCPPTAACPQTTRSSATTSPSSTKQPRTSRVD